MRLLSITPCSASLSLAGSLRTASRLTARLEPLGHRIQIARERAELPDRFRSPLRIDRHEVMVLANVDPRAIRVHHFEALPPSPACAPSRDLPNSVAVAGGEESRRSLNLLNEVAGEPAPSVTEADHGSGQAPLRVLSHANGNDGLVCKRLSWWITT